MNNLYPKCSICGVTPPEGLYDGIRLTGKFICSGCENHIIAVAPYTEGYCENVQTVRKLIYG